MSWRAGAFHFGGCALLGRGKSDGRPSCERGLIWPTLCLAECVRSLVQRSLSEPHLIGLVSAGPNYRAVQHHNSAAQSARYSALFRVTGLYSPVTVSVLICTGRIRLKGESVIITTMDGRDFAAPSKWSAIVTFDSQVPKEPFYVLGDQCMQYGSKVLAPAVTEALAKAA